MQYFRRHFYVCHYHSFIVVKALVYAILVLKSTNVFCIHFSSLIKHFYSFSSYNVENTVTNFVDIIVKYIMQALDHISCKIS
jgi:hypothetical protein